MADESEVPTGPVEWQIDPVELALRESTARSNRADPPLPESFCLETGRRLLLAQLEFSQWMLRRIEKVEFERDRNVTRRVTIEFRIRDDAPIFVDREENKYWLVPLSLMRRRTLVNLSLQDEHGRPIAMPGIRLQQRLDQSLLMAAAATQSHQLLGEPTGLREFVRAVIAGERDEVRTQMRAWADHGLKDATPGTGTAWRADAGDLKASDDAEADDNAANFRDELIDNRLFAFTLHRLHHNFTMYALLPVKQGRYRQIHMSFDEPTDWKYQSPNLRRLVHRDAFEYKTNRPVVWRQQWRGWMAALGLIPTRVRFQIPGADRCAGYHFELTAPQGLRIVRASMIAGRPNDPDRHVSVDHVVRPSPTVGLHAVEIPAGSLCRVQADVRVPTRGWLTTAVAAYWLSFIVLASVGLHLPSMKSGWTSDQVINVVLLLITTSAAIGTFMAQRDVHGVPARLLTVMRAIGVVAMALPVVAAGVLTYDASSPPAASPLTARVSGQEIYTIYSPAAHRWLLGMTIGAGVVVFLATTALILAWRDERPGSFRRSPWDMTCDDKPEPTPTNFHAAVHELQYDTPAVGITSAEGWLETYDWDDAEQQKAVSGLRALASPLRPQSSPGCPPSQRTECASILGCQI